MADKELSPVERGLILGALQTEHARVKRSWTAEKDQTVRDARARTLSDLDALIRKFTL